MMDNKLKTKQQLVCTQYSAKFINCDMNLKVGISKNAKDGARPLNGLRINPTESTSGWYIWAGDWSDDDDFFEPLHGVHLDEWAPIILPYLALPPGWRVLLDDGYVDVWEDPELEL